MVTHLETTKLLCLFALATALYWAILVGPVEIRLAHLGAEQVRLDAELERKRPEAAEFARAKREKERLEQALASQTICWPCHEGPEGMLFALNEAGSKVGGRFIHTEVLPDAYASFVLRMSVAGDFVGTFAQVRALVGRLDTQRLWGEFSMPRLEAIPGDPPHLTARIVATHFRYGSSPPVVPAQGIPGPVPGASLQ